MDENKEIKMPDSLIVANAQAELRQIINTYKFPSYLWQLIVKDLFREIDAIHSSQIQHDKVQYEQKLKELELRNEEKEKKQNEDTCEC